MVQRSIPAPFLTKTYEMVDDEATDEVVSWGENGSTFVVWKTAEFAKDLLPTFFKHNNFSSFVRQLNTYGFRKIVPDKWEFSNDNFKKGQTDLLLQIRRRKTTLPGKATGTAGSQSASGDDAGSTSTSSPGTVEIADLSGKNEKLRRDNEMLSSELAQTKNQCEELISFLTTHLKVGPDQINKILRREVVGDMACGSPEDGVVEVNDGGCIDVNINIRNNDDGDDDNVHDDDDDDEKENEGLKLFGVWLKDVGEVQDSKKRGRCYDLQRDGSSNFGLIETPARKIVRIR